MLLAFDTATPHVTVALHDGNRVVAGYASEQGMRHGELLAVGIDEVLRQAGAVPGDVTAIAVGVGPGPYTGLRVGLVTARTMGLALGVPVHGLCSLDILAAEAVEAGRDEFVVATDARRKEVYVARYAAGHRIDGPQVLKPAVAATGHPVAGRGAVLYPEQFPHAIAPQDPSAAYLANAVAAGSYPVLPAEPLYLRRPDAVAPGAPKPVS